MMMHTPVCWNVPVAGWSVWQADVCAERLPDVSFVEPALRRRLGYLARMFFKVAHDCAGDIPSVRLVYASRHGDLSKTTAMLIDLADRQMLSPTAFSMSVPSAAAGIFSILKQDRSPSTTVSAACSSFGFGLIEASLQLAANPATPVLFVYADEPAPAIYEIASGDVFMSHAIGLLLVNGAEQKMACQMDSAEFPPSDMPQSQSFIRCLEGAGDTAWNGEGRTWSWRWRDRKD